MHISPSSLHALPYLQRLEHFLWYLPPLTAVFETWDTSAATHISRALLVRELMLGEATLPGASMQLLYEIAATLMQSGEPGKDLPQREKRPLHQRLIRHAATQSAEETQSVLPPGALVQKTVSVEMDGKLLLYSGVGAQPITRRQVHTLAAKLSLFRRATKRCTLNPATCDPVQEFEMLPGMVSPFLRPLRPTRLAALALVSWPRRWEEQAYEVAISLSPWESLLLPLRSLKAVLYSYARQAYPDLPVVELPPAALDDPGERTGSPVLYAGAGVTS